MWFVISISSFSNFLTKRSPHREVPERLRYEKTHAIGHRSSEKNIIRGTVQEKSSARGFGDNSIKKTNEKEGKVI